MDVRANTKYVRISPQKAGEVASHLRGKSASDGLAFLELCPRKAARLLGKTLKSAVANAENNFELERDDLKIKVAQVDPGPVLKRYRPKARGMAGRIRKRTSHFTVVLTDD